MKSLLPATLIALLMVGYGESTAQIKGKQSSLVADVDEVVGGVMDNYSSIESGFAEAENALRSTGAPVIKILDDLEKLISGKRAESEGMKDQLLTLKKKLEDRKKKIELSAGNASYSLKESYGSALSEIEGKLKGKIKPLLDFDFPNLGKFEKDLSESILEWKEYLGNVNGVLDEGLIRNELANRISEHFRDKLTRAIEERRSKWGSVVKARKERVQKEQIDGRPSFVDNLPKPTEQRSPKHINPVNPQQEAVQNDEKNISGTRFVENFTIHDIRFEMIWVKPGTFTMGSPKGFFAEEKGRDDDETQHQVTLTKGFYLGKHEVTQAQWERVMGSNPSKYKGSDRPVETVSWNDAVAFCKKLTETERRAGRLPAGMAYQLPTEAQWEYAYRAGARSAYSFGKGSGELYRYANYADRNTDYDWSDKSHDDGFENTSPVGKYPANAWGFHDMHGNVWEWCADWYGDYPRGTVRDPVGPPDGSGRVRRGGSWYYSANDARCADRSRSVPADSSGDQGFRLSLRLVSK